MSNYNYQYKKYYEDLQNKNVSQNKSPIYRRDSFEAVYGENKNKKENKEFFSSMTNVFIYQLVVVTFMLMAAFYLKYSPSEQKYYEEIKAVINNTEYSTTEETVETFKFSDVVDKIGNYIKLNLGGKKLDF